MGQSASTGAFDVAALVVYTACCQQNGVQCHCRQVSGKSEANSPNFNALWAANKTLVASELVLLAEHFAALPVLQQTAQTFPP